MFATLLACGGKVTSNDDASAHTGVGGDVGAGGTMSTGGSGATDPVGTGGAQPEPSGVSTIEVCRERRDLVDLVWSDEDSMRLSCNVDAVTDSIWDLSFDNCVEDAEACIADAEASVAPPVWDCETLTTADAEISLEQRSDASQMADQCFNDWKAIVDNTKYAATCEALTENPGQIASTAIVVGLLVSAPALLEPQSCKDFAEKYGGNGGGGDWD